MNNILSILKKNFKDVNIITGDNIAELTNIKGYISTGNSLLNLIISGLIDGGIPYGRITEIYGREGTGKSTFAMQLSKEVIDNGGYVFYIDSENAFNIKYAQQMKLFNQENKDRFTLINSGLSLEKFFEIVDEITKFSEENSEIPILIVLDSIASILTESEIKENSFKVKGYNTARSLLLSQKLPLIVPKIASKKIAIVFINQVRDNPNITFGSTETTTGGNALKFYSTIRLSLTRQKIIYFQKEGVKKAIGQQILFNTVKNKINTSGKMVINLIYGYGIQPYSGWIDVFLEYGIIKKSGGWIVLEYVDKETGEVKVEKLREKQLLEKVKKDKNLKNYLLSEVKDKFDISQDEIYKKYFNEDL